MEAMPQAHFVAIDQDAVAVEYASSLFASAVAEKRLESAQFNFHDINQFPHKPADGFDEIFLDLGVSSPQLDEAKRGFSFYNDGPLDMRMNQTQKLTAADIVNNWSEVELN